MAVTAAIVAGTVTFMATHPPRGNEAQASASAVPPAQPTQPPSTPPPDELVAEPEPVRDAGAEEPSPGTARDEATPDIHDEAAYTRAETKRAVLMLLNDPRSAQFRRVGYTRFENGAAVICGEVNAKNGFGGYGDYLPFYGTGSWATVYDGSSSWEIGFRRQCLDKPIEGVFPDF